MSPYRVLRSSGAVGSAVITPTSVRIVSSAGMLEVLIGTSPATCAGLGSPTSLQPS